ncbi:DNA-binding response regulator [filamentous cyanobacterium CCP5]|nr:DNA-binding response regulator [filamentous cyanobacterium CCP5]
MIRLVLADDQGMFRQGLVRLLSLEPDMEILAEAMDGRGAIALAEHHQPDVILMDMRMPQVDGVEATRTIHQRFPWIRILVLSTFDEDDYIQASLRAGPLGYLLKSTPTPQLAAAIRTVYQGYGHLGPTIAPKVFTQRRPPCPEADYQHRFTQRELDILHLLRQGYTNREMATTLHLSIGTVKNHLTRILSQLGARSRQAALWAHQHLTPPHSLADASHDLRHGDR